MPEAGAAEANGTLEKVHDDAKPSYSRSGLAKERAGIISQRLDAYMQAEKPYLDAELTIDTLAKKIAVPRRHLTQVLSERHEKNFFLFVNEFRIQAVKDALKSPESTGRTLLEIAYASGFNSKSTFNTAFKQNTGLTPSQFRARAT